MSASEPQESGSVRIGHSLNKYEEEFVARRRKDVLQSLEKLQITCSENKVPNIALLGSGGGSRAMVGLLGSLDQLQKAGLLDCVLYLSGVSGSTWCMASLYQEPDWSTKLETVKGDIIKTLCDPAVEWGKAFDKLKKYYEEKKDTNLFSLTDVWAAMIVTTCVKEINEHTLSDQRDRHNKDPFPIYTVIDKQSKQNKDADPWFEISPYEAGYSLTGAFVETSNFGSKFKNGRKIKNHPEIDMLYLQALCGSALADGDETRKVLFEKIKGFVRRFIPTFIMKSKTQMYTGMEERKDSDSPSIDECYRELMDLVDMNLDYLNREDPSAHDKYIRTQMCSEISEGGNVMISQTPLFGFVDIKQFWIENVFERLSRCVSFVDVDLWKSIFKCMAQWTWGTKYNFLHNMKDEAVPTALVESETRDYEDTALLLNSPYFSVLREERDIDLIISLDFSETEPFTTVTKAAEMCKKLKIPFPEVNIPSGDVKKPKDFYVFKGQNTPTVIHIPLFNVVNCGDDIKEWRNKYGTIKLTYSAEMITKLMEVAGKNITNNRDNLLEQIRLAMKNTKDE